MQKFKLNDLIEWMDKNPDKEVYFGHPTIDPPVPVKNYCLMCSFFSDVLGDADFKYVSWDGRIAQNKEGDEIAEIELPKSISDVHLEIETHDDGHVYVKQIKDRMIMKNWI